MRTYLITPLNEGQQLNYVEIMKHVRSPGAIRRANFMAMQLAEILNQASISIKVEDSETLKLTYYGNVIKDKHGPFRVEDITKDMK